MFSSYPDQIFSQSYPIVKLTDVFTVLKKGLLMKKYYKCDVCGNIVLVIQDSGNTPICCMRDMHELVPGEVDASVEKHVPDVKISDNQVKVCVGTDPHPMTEAHKIEWIALETDKGYYHKTVFNKDVAKACFLLKSGETPQNVYAYCNLHGLWIRALI